MILLIKQEIKTYGWYKIERELYLTLDSKEFLNQLDEYQIEMTISEISTKKVNRNQIYNWLKRWISIQPTVTLERLLKFITGTTRIPLNRKIMVMYNSLFGFPIYKLKFVKN